MKKTILIAAVMFFALTVAAFGQASFQVASTPVISVSSCGVTELTGDIAFTQVAGSPPIQTGTITINYGVPITALQKADGTAANVTVKDTTGTIVGTIPLSNALGGNVSGNLLTFTVTPPASGTQPFTFTVSGVRVNVAGNPGLTSLSASVSSTVNLFIGGQTTVVVISSIAPAISGISATPPFSFTSTALTVNAVSKAPLPSNFKVFVTEGFANAFVLNQIIGFTFGAIPAGISVTPANTIVTDPSGTAWTLVDSTGAAIAATAITSASTNLTVLYKLTTIGGTTVTDLEVPSFQFNVATTVGAPSPLPQGTVTVTADILPKDFLFSTQIPRYAGTTCQKGPITVVTIQTANTILLMPFATVGSGFDTGIAIANTTKDPLGAAQTAVPQNGTITFTFFPQTGASFNYTTSATSPGGGLTNGVLNSGGMYSVLLSQLLTAAGGPATFSGYVFAVVNSTDCHGQYFVSDFEAFTNGALMLVVNPANRNQQVSAPEALDN